MRLYHSDPSSACYRVRNARRYKIDLTAYPRIVAIDSACVKLDAFRRARPE